MEASRVDTYLAYLQRVIPHHDWVTLRYLTADGYFGKVKFVDGVKAMKPFVILMCQITGKCLIPKILSISPILC